jgi:hypothetical protein
MGLSHEEIMLEWAETMAARHAVLGFEEGAQIPEVAEFRRKYVPKGLVSHSSRQINSWLRDQASRAEEAHNELTPRNFYYEEDPRAVEFCSGTRTPGLAGMFDEDGQAANPQGLKFDIASGLKRYEITAHPYGALSELHWLSRKILPEQFGWTPASAAAWLFIRGVRPKIPYLPQSLDFAIAGKGSKNHPYIGVTMTVPIDMPPTRLAREFESIQEMMRDQFRFDLPGKRPAGQTSLDRMLFAVQRNDGRSWAQLLSEWNKEMPDHAIAETKDGATQFASQVRRTYRNVMSRPIDWQGASKRTTSSGKL